MKKILIHYSLLFSVIVSRSRYKNWIKFPIKDGALTDNYFLLTENYFMTLKLKLYIDVHKRYRLIRLHIIYKRTSNPYLSHKTGFSGKNLKLNKYFVRQVDMWLRLVSDRCERIYLSAKSNCELSAIRKILS